MPQFAEVIFNITEAWVAALSVTNTYSTPVAIDLIGKVSFTYETDTDEIMSAGLVVDSLAIPKKAKGEMTQSSLDFAAMATMCGFLAGNYGTTPNQYGIMDVAVGGDGMPYFGLLVAYAATLGGNMYAGFPKAKLETVPGFDVDQNKFRIGKAGFSAFAPSTTTRKVVRYKRNETKATLTAAGYTASGAAFLGYFTTPPPSLFA